MLAGVVTGSNGAHGLTARIDVRLARALLLGLSASLLLAARASVAGANPSYLAGDQSLVRYYAGLEGGKLGVALPGGAAKFIKLVESPERTIRETTSTGKTIEALGITSCRSATGKAEAPVSECTITLARAAHERGELRPTIAHEVFHVYQAVMAGTIANFDRPGAGWLVEGSAAWVESDLAHDDYGARSWWRSYLATPHTSLFSREYDAIGFFGHMAQIGISPWSRFKAIFQATSNEAAYLAAIGSGHSFLDSEASVFFREPALGASWDVHGPNVPSAGEVRFKPTEEKLAGAQELVTVAPYADGAYRVSTKKMPAGKPVLEVIATGVNMRLHSTDGGEVDEVDVGHLKLCTSSKGCECPSHPSGALKQFKEGDLAVAGGPGGGSVWLIPKARCEQLLAPTKCETLLPGFSTEFGEALKEKGLHVAQEDNIPAIGYYSSDCAFSLSKGEEVEKGEGRSVFDGVIALFVDVTRYSSVAQAERSFSLPPPLPAPAAPPAVVPGVGSQAGLVSSVEVSSTGERTCASVATLRVDNVDASFSLVSSGGNTEAEATATIELMNEVVEELSH